jgi:hypothetical protein
MLLLKALLKLMEKVLVFPEHVAWALEKPDNPETEEPMLEPGLKKPNPNKTAATATTIIMTQL